MYTLQEQVTALYRFFGDIIKIHHLNPDISEDTNESVKLLEDQLFSNNEDDNIRIKEMTPLLNKILYKLYSDKGIKRKLVNNVIQLFYDKTHPSYDKDDAVTQLCRHLVIDPRNLRIISMGITKACDYESFKEHNAFQTVRFEDFQDGTFLVYTPELERYQNETQYSGVKNIVKAETDTTTVVEDTSVVEHEGDTPLANVTETVEVTVNGEVKEKRTRDFKCSTRKVLGTGFFNSPSKSFNDMFMENNKRTGLDLELLPSEYKSNHSLVFNVQHNENRIVTPIEKDKGVNTLCAVYKFKSNEQATSEWDDLVKSLQTNTDIFDDKLEVFSTNMATQINLTDFMASIVESGLPFTLIKDITDEILKTYSDYESFEKFIHSKPYEYQGVVMKTESGIRTKLRNEKYDEIKDLKGSLPIMTEEKNIDNLFKTYWRLRQKQDKSLTKFCQYFGKNIYSNIFNCFNQDVYQLTRNLHSTYMDAFVNKTMQKSDIPYEFKPMCGDLHKLYNDTKKPVTLNVVITYINNSPDYKIYWRIFGAPDNKNDAVEAKVDETSPKDKSDEDKVVVDDNKVDQV